MRVFMAGLVGLVGVALTPLAARAQQAAPPGGDVAYWRSYAQTLAVARQGCENVQNELRVQLDTDQKRLQELQQKLAETEAKGKEAPKPASSEGTSK